MIVLWILLIKIDGQAYSIGWNTSGQCGQDPLLFPSIANYPQKVAIIPDSNIIDCICGDNHSLLLSEDGQVYSFGR